MPVAHTVTAAGVDPAADTMQVDIGTGYTEDTAASQLTPPENVEHAPAATPQMWCAVTHLDIFQFVSVKTGAF